MSENSAPRGHPAEEPGIAAGDQTPAGAEPSVEDLRAQAAESWNRYLRTAADLENLRKRHARELENTRKFGAERLAAAILPVRDSLESGLAATAQLKGATADLAAVLDGQRATLRLLDEALELAGVRVIDPHGEPFDAHRHEAISVQVSPTCAPDTVLMVVQTGYELYDRLLRPARVIVAKAP